MTTTIISVLLAFQVLSASSTPDADWGFYSHRLINRMAVFTLPADLIGLYKVNVDYISDHAVDPDKRRYATRHEAVRHYIDIDHWGEYPFDNVPRNWTNALALHTEIICVSSGGDTSIIMSLAEDDTLSKAFTDFFRHQILPQYYEEVWQVDCDSLQLAVGMSGCSDCQELIAREGFSAYGILPYHLRAMQARLTRAFEEKDLPNVLRLSADFGHYIADAHVPLHTTENYNGQFTDQLGIHAFWETRIPELFAESQFDFFVGSAEYIQDPTSYYWDIVLKSHRLVGEVLSIEKQLSIEYPSNAQFCFEERLEVTSRTQCLEYARAYHKTMNGMVEERMREAIRAIGSAWYTAWVDAGQPSFDGVSNALSPADQAAFDELEQQFRLGDIKGRVHRN